MSQPQPKRGRKQERAPDNLYRRNGVWWIRYNVGGRKIRRSLATRSQREAKRLRDQILAKRSVAAKFGIEEPIPKPERTFAEVFDLWLQARRAVLSMGHQAPLVRGQEPVRVARSPPDPRHRHPRPRFQVAPPTQQHLS